MANENRYKEFPLDGNNKPVSSSTERHLLIIDGDALWHDIIVPEGVECKACLVVVHTMDATNYGNFLPPGEYHYNPTTAENPTEWIPMQSGPQPWAGKEGTYLGQICAAANTKISILMMA